jgi:alkylresorcinol/alkylpyrone synthase
VQRLLLPGARADDAVARGRQVLGLLRGDVDAFLSDHGLARKDIRRWVAHSGGPKVLEAFEEAFEQPREAFRKTWDSLEKVGNLSSASVLFVLADELASDEAEPGDWGLLLAMGPAFCSELVLLRW